MIEKEKNKFQTREDKWRTAWQSREGMERENRVRSLQAILSACSSRVSSVPKVRFNDTPQVYTHEVERIAYSHEKSHKKPCKAYTTSKCPRPDFRDTEEAIKGAQSLQAMVKSMLLSSAERPKCQFICDHDPVGPHDLCCTKCRKKRGFTEVFNGPFNTGKETFARNCWRRRN